MTDIDPANQDTEVAPIVIDPDKVEGAWLREADACVALKISPRTLHRRVAAGRMVSRTEHGRTRFFIPGYRGPYDDTDHDDPIPAVLTTRMAEGSATPASAKGDGAHVLAETIVKEFKERRESDAELVDDLVARNQKLAEEVGRLRALHERLMAELERTRVGQAPVQRALPAPDPMTLAVVEELKAQRQADAERLAAQAEQLGRVRAQRDEARGEIERLNTELAQARAPVPAEPKLPLWRRWWPGSG